MTDTRLQKMQKMAQRFHDSGTVDALTMRKIDALAMQERLVVMTGPRIRALRQKQEISQGVLAVALNMSVESVRKWEQGKSQPQGAALKVLNLIERDGIASVL
ncbi:helix-turn-helix domain-containing protein [Aeromonas aquatica]|uniref:helix-turn-helix domain-containing protein n=1 Tax=Aeromonas aquatica TaxID=558964 RepID=UPI00286F94B4|nr:helix-turn-helix domain-containing protein [Aeromonas aquatica]